MYCTTYTYRRVGTPKKQQKTPVGIFLIFMSYECSALSAGHWSTGYGRQSYSLSAEQGSLCFPCSRSHLRTWSPETGSADPSRVSPLIVDTQAQPIIWCLLTGFLRRPYVSCLHRQLPSGHPVPSFSGHALAYRWRSLPKIRRHGTSSPQGSPGNWCYLFRCHRGPIRRASFFFAPTRRWYV